MADFCKQCAEDLGFPQSDFIGLTTKENTEKKLFPVVLCEGCGPIQVDHEGVCVSVDCVHKHGEQP